MVSVASDIGREQISKSDFCTSNQHFDWGLAAIDDVVSSDSLRPVLIQRDYDDYYIVNDNTEHWRETLAQGWAAWNEFHFRPRITSQPFGVVSKVQTVTSEANETGERESLWEVLFRSDTHEHLKDDLISRYTQFVGTLMNRTAVGPVSDWSRWKNSVEQLTSIISTNTLHLIVSDFLGEYGFETDELHTDSLGAAVFDSYQGDQRVSVFVKSNNIQVLAFLHGDFHEKVFEPDASAKVEIRKFISDILTRA
ncbi:MAG: hypothetical protein AAFP81_02330 [Pseudomonadota bacterium]